jgi:hypothetical protein
MVPQDPVGGPVDARLARLVGREEAGPLIAGYETTGRERHRSTDPLKDGLQLSPAKDSLLELLKE